MHSSRLLRAVFEKDEPRVEQKKSAVPLGVAAHVAAAVPVAGAVPSAVAAPAAGVAAGVSASREAKALLYCGAQPTAEVSVHRCSALDPSVCAHVV